MVMDKLNSPPAGLGESGVLDAGEVLIGASRCKLSHPQ